MRLEKPGWVHFWVVIFGTTAVSLLSAYLALNVFQKDPGVEGWRAALTNWDGNRFIEIARFGYGAYDTLRQSLVGHFPLYPLLIRLTHFIVGDYRISSLVVSNLFYVAAMLCFFQLTLMDRDLGTALRAVFLLSIFPTAYIFHMAYAESLFLFLVLASFTCARKEKFFWAGLFGMLASSSRFLGIVLLPALLVEYLHQKRFKLQAVRPNILYPALVPLGLALQLGISRVVYADAWAYFKRQEDFWGRSFDMPWVGLWNAYRVIVENYSADKKIFYGFFEIGFMLFALLTGAAAVRRLRPSYAIYAIGLLAAISFNSRWAATPRYLLMVFPLFIYLAGLVRKPAAGLLFVLVSCALQLYFLVHFFGKPYLAF